MPIVIKDETANMVVLTIDNNGNMAFGDGTPINMLTLSGYGIIDSEGYIVHGLGSSTVFPSSGYVNVPADNGRVRIDTITGVIPTAVCDTTYPAYNYDLAYSLPPSDPDWPNSGYETQNSNNQPLHYPLPDVGCFYIQNNNVVMNTALTDPNSQYYDAYLAGGQGCNYRWI